MEEVDIAWQADEPELETPPAAVGADPGVDEVDELDRPALLTALLFASGELLPQERLGAVFSLTPDGLDLLVEESAGALRPLGLDIVSAAGGYRLVTAAQWDGQLRQFFRQQRKSKLSRNALEILAVIAYEQPVTRVRVDELRQSSSESAVRTLLERRLITVASRDDGPGRAFRYKTTEAFLELFGLASITDLPPRPASFESAAGGQQGGLDLGAALEDDSNLAGED